MRPTLKKIIMSVFAIILLPGVSNITADAQYGHWATLAQIWAGNCSTVFSRLRIPRLA
jgi:hypothetical protein